MSGGKASRFDRRDVRHFVMSGLIPRQLGDLSSDLFEQRREGDYEDGVWFEASQVKPRKVQPRLIEKARPNRRGAWPGSAAGIAARRRLKLGDPPSQQPGGIISRPRFVQPAQAAPVKFDTFARARYSTSVNGYRRSVSARRGAGSPGGEGFGPRFVFTGRSVACPLTEEPPPGFSGRRIFVPGGQHLGERCSTTITMSNARLSPFWIS